MKSSPGSRSSARFGIKISPEYGGLGLSQTNYCRAAMLLGSYCGNLTALLSAHQSIGVPQPLILFGTEEQKRRFLPRVAGGEVSAFALTEPKVGSDPAKMETHAEPIDDGEHFVINGEKLWCTNGVKAGVLVVMAKTPPKNGRSQVTAFIVNTDTPGVEIVQPLPLHGPEGALQCGGALSRREGAAREHHPRRRQRAARGAHHAEYRPPHAPRRLHRPRQALPGSLARAGPTSACNGARPIGQHAAIADKLARMAADIFAMEAMTFYTASLVDRDKHADIRLEAAMCKLWASERTWHIVDETMQIRGGRGYETAASLAAPRRAADPGGAAACATAGSTPSSKAPARSCGSSSRAKRSTRTCASARRC